VAFAIGGAIVAYEFGRRSQAAARTA
jgi:hypothetical protein